MLSIFPYIFTYFLEYIGRLRQVRIQPTMISGLFGKTTNLYFYVYCSFIDLDLIQISLPCFLWAVEWLNCLRLANLVLV